MEPGKVSHVYESIFFGGTKEGEYDVLCEGEEIIATPALYLFTSQLTASSLELEKRGDYAGLLLFRKTHSEIILEGTSKVVLCSNPTRNKHPFLHNLSCQTPALSIQYQNEY